MPEDMPSVVMMQRVREKISLRYRMEDVIGKVNEEGFVSQGLDEVL